MHSAPRAKQVLHRVLCTGFALHLVLVSKDVGKQPDKVAASELGRLLAIQALHRYLNLYCIVVCL
jgi:hypothetical protein